MQPSKSKSTRYQPKALYLVASLLFCLSTVVGFSLEYDLPWINQAIAMLPSHNYVHWRTCDQAWRECQKTHKPILYFVLVKKDPASMMLDTQCLGDPAVAELIDSQFIPVMLWIEHSKINDMHDQTNKWVTEQLGLNTYSAPFIVAVPFSLNGLKVNDIVSSSNLVELRIEGSETLTGEQDFYPSNNNGWGGFNQFHHGYAGRFAQVNGGGICYGFSDKPDFLEFLYSARLWHKLPPTVGRVKWLSVADLRVESKGAKPKLLALVQDVGASSDSMRVNLFWKNKSVKLINEKFDPYLIEFHRQDPAYNSKFAALRKKYGIKELPALVVLNSPSKSEIGPPVEHGFSNTNSSVEFLESTLKPGHK
jgi:hypothetical protein